jgi:uncharacterized protein YdaU (DUF1376 family)
MHYYEFNIGDYMRDTAHLDEMEDLAYRRMLDLYYLKESPLPANIQEIAKLIRMRTHSESIANVLREYFTLTDAGYVNAKANSTLIKIYDKSEKAKKSAEKRWENQRLKNANALQTDSERNANGMLPNNPIPNNPIPNNLEPNNVIVDSDESPAEKKVDFLSEMFDKFWNHYKTKQGKQKALTKFKAFLKGKSEGQCRFWMNLMLAYYMDCRERQVVGYDALHAATYIHNKRWEDNPEFMENFKREWLANEQR